MSINERQKIFESNSQNNQGKLGKLTRQSTFIAIVRFIIFLGLLGLSVYYLVDKKIIALGISGVVLVSSFFMLVLYHNRLKEQIRVLKNIIDINERELRVLQYDLDAIDGGLEYQDPKHPYTSDLDIFGRRSVFSLLNRTATTFSKSRLASWLLGKTTGNEILERQEAVRELTPLLNWRQEFEAQKVSNSNSDSSILSWLSSEGPRISKSYWMLVFTIPLTTLFLMILVGMGFVTYTILSLPIIAGLISLRAVNKQIEQVYEETKQHIGTLDSVYKLLSKAESYHSESQYLTTRCGYLRKTASSKQVQRLHGVLDRLNGRANLFYWIFNTIFLIDVYILYSFINWKKINQHHISGWFDSLSEIDAVISLAGFAYMNPKYSYPEITANVEISCIEIGHPLIPEPKRVSNDFTLQDHGSLGIVTGSNMSGKSTFLRTLGVNAVLAYTGAPVCASDFKIGELSIFTSMRVVDDLNQNMSSFYAELDRIRQLLDVLKQDSPVLYLLDEILLGTNSKDRHAGSVALVKQLINGNCAGLIATHDLKLGELANEYPEIHNYCFTSEIKGDEIIFDYKIKEGIGYNFNATELMKKMGLNL